MKWIVALAILMLVTGLTAQVFIPFGFRKGRVPALAVIANVDGPQNVAVSASLVVSNSTGPNCTTTYWSATSSDITVLPLANISFSGTFPNCVMNMTTNLNTGTSTVTVTFTSEFSLQVSRSFTFTAYQSPVMAFSFRRVVKNYAGSAIRVRRVLDNVEADIGFDVSGNFDGAAFTTFRGASSLMLKTWYDQSGNGYHATQTTNGLQPAINLTGFNGFPQVEFQNLYWLSSTQAQNIMTSNRDLTIFYATKAISEARTIFGVRASGGSNRIGTHLNWSDGSLYWDSPGTCCAGSRISASNAANVNLPKVYAMGRSNTYQYVKVNGVNLVTQNAASGTLTAGTLAWCLGCTNINGTASEIASSPLAEYVQYLSGLTDSQVTSIATEQKNYYGL